MTEAIKQAPDWTSGQRALTAADLRSAALAQVEIFDGDERHSAAGYTVKAHPIHGIKSIPVHGRHAGIVYGAIMTELTSPAIPTELGMMVQSGRSGGGCAVDRRLEMIRLRDVAWFVVPDHVVALEPMRAARKPKGSATLGRKHRATNGAGTMMTERRPIPARVLLDHVCVEGLSISNVLLAHGWRTGGKSHERLTKCLSVILCLLSDAWGGHEGWVAGDWTPEAFGAT